MREKIAVLLVVGVCGAGICITDGEGRVESQNKNAVPVIQINPIEGGVSVEITPPKPVFKNSELRGAIWESEITVAGFGSRQVPGEPILPYRAWQIAVPDENSFKYEITTLRFKDFGKINPRSAPYSEADEHGDITKTLIDENKSIYGSGEYYPDSPVSVKGGGVFRHTPFVTLEVMPVSVNPRQNRVRYYDKIVVKILFEKDAMSYSAERAVSEDRHFGDMSDMFLNPEDAKRFKRPPRERLDLDIKRKTNLGGGGTTPLGVENESESYKISISANGIYRLTYGYLDANTDLPVETLDPRNFQMFNKGAEIPIYVHGESDGVFNSGDYIEFYGEGHFGEDIAERWQKGDYTDTNIYWLKAGESAGLRMATRDGAPLNGYAQPANFVNTIHYEKNDANAGAGDLGVFIPKMPYLGADHWFWDELKATAGNPQSRNYNIVIPSPASITGDAALAFEMHSTTSIAGLNPDHIAKFYLDNNLFAEEEWDGRRFYNFTATINHNILTQNSVLKIEACDVGNLNYIQFNWFDLTYTRLFEAYQNQLPFSYSEGNHRFRITKFSGSDIRIYDIGDPKNPARIVNPTIVLDGSTYTLTFEDSVPSATTRRYFAHIPQEITDASAIVKNTPSDLKNTALGADWIIIVPNEFFNAAAIADLMNHRANKGLRTQKVRVDDIYDEFSHGVFDPQAIRDFLSYAYFNWTPPSPAFVLLVGETSYDYKDNFKSAIVYKHVPTFMQDELYYLGYYAHDTWYGAVDGSDDIPDIHISRLSVTNSSELGYFINRILNYEQSPPTGTWRGKSILVSDEGDSTFESAHNNAAGKMESPATSSKIYYAKSPWFGTNSCPSSPCIRNDILNSINDGAAIVSYFGHGSTASWSGDQIFRNTELDNLKNGSKSHFMFNASCYTANIHSPIYQTAMMEKVTRLDGQGAVSAYAPSGTGTVGNGYNSIDTIFEDIFGRYKYRNIGDITIRHRTRMINQFAKDEGCMYVLLGDPATNLIVPAPKPPTDLQVDSVGDRSVTLVWTASAGATGGYHVYRRQYNNYGAFTRITGTPVSGTTYTDSDGLTNNSTYYYYVVSRDTEGYIGASSNEVSAVPRNPDPPAVPVITDLQDPALGRRLTVFWNANTEPDLAYYTIHYGATPGPPYELSKNVDKSYTDWVLGDLTDGIVWHIAMTATNTSERTSDYSSEWSKTPTHTQGYKPPKLIRDLKVEFSESNYPLLKWTAPTTDIWGGAITLSRFAIYRGTNPNFVPDRSPSSTDRLGEVLYEGGKSVYVYEDTKAAGEAYFYYVTAYGTTDNEGSVSKVLPTPVYNFYEYREEGWVDIWWGKPSPPRDVEGNETIINRYHIYGSLDPSFQPDRYDHSNLLYSTTGYWVSCCEGCEINIADCELYIFRIVIVDDKGNEGIH